MGQKQGVCTTTLTATHPEHKPWTKQYQEGLGKNWGARIYLLFSNPGTYMCICNLYCYTDFIFILSLKE